MSFTGNHMPDSFKRQLLEGVHDFRPEAHVFKLALYTSSATLNAATTEYTPEGEVAATGDYTTGGVVLTCTGVASGGGVGFASFAPISIAAGTLTARGALIYNSTPNHTYTNPACLVLDFGSDKVISGKPFQITFPEASERTAILRIA